MTWRTYTRLPYKKFWEGDEWPEEISQQTRENAAKAGWDARGWASVRNASRHPFMDAVLDDLRAPAHPIPAGPVAEMVERLRAPGDLGDGGMLDAIFAGTPLCVAWLLAADKRSNNRISIYWDLAQRLGLDGLELAGWWHTGRLELGKYVINGPREPLVVKLGDRINPWITALGHNAYLWVLAGYSLADAKTVAKNGTVTEEDLRAVTASKGIRLPQHLNDHCAPELDPDPKWDAAKAEPLGWVIGEYEKHRVWTKDGWPPDLPEQTRLAAASAGWNDRDWVRLHTATRRTLNDWFWDMPIFAHPVDPDALMDLIDANGWLSHARLDPRARALDVVASESPILVISIAARRIRMPKSYVTAEYLDESTQLGLTLGMVRQLNLTEREAAGWLMTGYLDVSVGRWKRGDAVDLVTRKISPWRNKYGPTAYLYVLAGIGLREAAKTVKQPGWDETALRVMVALNDVVLPPGV